MQAAIALYLTIATLIFCILLISFLLDHSTLKTDKKSWAVVILGSIFWVVVMPLSFLEVTCKFLKIGRHSPKRNRSIPPLQPPL
jgi:cytochrome c oxidase subunit IV